MNFKKQNPHTKNFDTFIEEHIDKDRYEKIKKQAEARAKVLRAEIDATNIKSKKQNQYTADFDTLVEKRFGKEKLAESKKEAHREAEILEALHKLVTSSIDEYMQEQQVGFNELARRLKLSPTYVAKMRKGQANLTFGTFAQVMGILGK